MEAPMKQRAIPFRTDQRGQANHISKGTGILRPISCERLGVYTVVKPQKPIRLSLRRQQFQKMHCRPRSQFIAVYYSWGPATTEQCGDDNEVDLVDQVLTNHRSTKRPAPPRELQRASQA
jgi:hypothetical protein